MSSASQLVPLGDFSAMVAMLARAANISEEEAGRRLRFELDALGNNVRADLAAYNVVPYEWSDSLAEFYGKSQAFLFESLAWNDMPMKQGMRDWIVDYLRRCGRAERRILCCGDGLGFDSAALALAGHRTTYFEVSVECRKFAADVFAHNGAAVEMVDSLATLDSGTFDVVVCLDVLEHVPQPTGFVESLAKLLKPDGLLIAHAPFWLLDAATPTHLQANLRFSGDWRNLYGAFGLTPIAGRYFWNPIVLRKDGTSKTSPLGDRIVAILGGVLLKCQRIWSWPLQKIVRIMLNGEQRRRRKALLGADDSVAL